VSRITCKTPSTGRSFIVSQANVSTTYTTIAEAPDFSVPDPSENYATRDPLDNNRAIRPGEVFFVTPLAAKNKSASVVWVEIRLFTEANTAIDFGRVAVPPGDTAFIPIQGRSLFKRIADGTNGDRLQVRAEANNVFDVWSAAEEKLSAEHIGVTP
jgi:hypothetical protein